MKRIGFLILLTIWHIVCWAYTEVHIADPKEWAASELAPYVGQTITFTTPFYVCNNYRDLVIAPRRTMSPTNQLRPGKECDALIRNLHNGEITLTGVSDYHRMGERIENLTVYVSSTSSVRAVGEQTFVGNTRADLQKGYPSVDLVGEHNLLVCAFNLEYYLVDNLGTGYGPDDQTESNRQHTKIMDALTHIGADIFGFVEIEQGQAALRKLANALSMATGRQYGWVNDGGSAYGSYTKSGYVYCTETVKPYGNLRNNDSGVNNRKKMQAFTEIASGETFIFSLNHFKAKSGQGTGDNADQDDGQGTFNGDRVREAESVLSQYAANRVYFGTKAADGTTIPEDDILIMGDLNAYGKEDPIITLIDGGMTDLYRYFHADSAYSYVFRGQAGYLDHALANETMLTQITGVQAYHINSDESDSYTYDKSNDVTMFRSSDHDPVLVGLALGEQVDIPTSDESYDACELRYLGNGQLVIRSAKGGYYRVYDLMGNLLSGTRKINNAEETVNLSFTSGIYIVQVFVENQSKTFKFIL